MYLVNKISREQLKNNSLQQFMAHEAYVFFIHDTLHW